MPALSASTQGLLDGLRTGARWWVGELAGLLPRRLGGQDGARSGRVDLWLAPDETRVEHVVDGVGQRLVDPRPLGDLDEDAWQQLADLAGDQPVRAVLLVPDIYVTRLTLPRQVGGRIRQAAALQLSEVSPVRPEWLRWNITRPLLTADRIEVDVVMARAERVDAIIAAFAGRGLAVAEVMAETDGQTVLLESAAAGEPLSLFRRRPPWLVALVLLMSIPITTIAAASIFSWANMRVIATLEPQAEDLMRQEKRARVAEQLRQAIAPIARQIAASKILDGLAGRLPKDAYVIEAERDPQGRLNLVIDAADPDTVRDALAHDGLFRFDEVDETIGDDGQMRMTYRGRPR